MGNFNHNDHYHDFLLRQVPDGCRRALEVGCGSGTFARKLAARGIEVDAVDRSAEMIAVAERMPGVRYVHADVRELDLAGYDFVSCIASLHHVPFAATVTHLRDALRPGGVLAVLGLSRPTLRDLPFGAVAFLPNRVRILLAPHRDDPMPPVRDADMTWPEVRAQAAELLPGARGRRHLYFRYSLSYRA
ncbi:MAG TPA: class I SAM-dependent methyltransferase [Actinophytocola sp.]|jgi:SAM-dependent methyltransferase|nr:class I SAM-dependent methyltransferase [Actinophytocola sp.]